MVERTLLSVGYEIPGWTDSCLDFDSDQSLLDADVILFQPTLGDYSPQTSYQGKPSLSDDASAQVYESCRRWKHELKEALKAGKTVFIYLSPLDEVFVHLGKKEYSGTGRNQSVTRIIQPLKNYDALPFDLGEIIPKGGKEVRVASDLKQLAPYWSTYGSQSPYQVYFKNPTGTPLLTAKAPDAIVGLIIKTGKGAAVLLPPLAYDDEDFTSQDSEGQFVWNKQGIAFGDRLIRALLELDRAFRTEAAITPAPEWTARPDFRLASELGLEQELRTNDTHIERLHKERAALEARSAEAASLRDLLYETGKPLERAILKALGAMGFSAIPFREDGSEFDAVFTSTEGRFIGEAEGKNDKAINIDKLDQLERNIREDFSREESGAYAKGVLFGNAYRLREPDSRQEFFTAKCHAAAARGKVALVRTPDLFAVAKYLDSHQDAAFATACRIALLAADGVVVAFPIPPDGRA